MTQFLNRRITRPILAAALSAVLLANNAAIAAPGAHGPNGEHLNGPTTMRAASALPRVEAQSESFELVAELRTGELAVVIDRFDSNEPVLGAKLEVETGALKAIATFRPEQGDYAVTDKAMQKALAVPGEHSLVFTVFADKESDLLEGTLVSAMGRVVSTDVKIEHEHEHEHEQAYWIAIGLVALGLIGGIAWWHQRRCVAGQLHKGL